MSPTPPTHSRAYDPKYDVLNDVTDDDKAGFCRPAVEGDVERIAKIGLRPEDAAEILAASGQTELEGLQLSYEASTPFVLTMETYGGKTVGMFGAAPYPDHEGCAAPWLLMTPLFYMVVREFVRQVPYWVEWLNALFPYLMNHVDARNSVAVAWLKKVGFTLEDPQPFGPEGYPFHRFYRIRKD